MRSLSPRERFGIFAVVAALAIVVSIPADATGPTISVGGLHTYSNTTAPCKTGQTCWWSNGNTPNFRKSDGTDINLSASGATTGNYTFSGDVCDLNHAANMQIGGPNASGIDLVFGGVASGSIVASAGSGAALRSASGNAIISVDESSGPVMTWQSVHTFQCGSVACTVTGPLAMQGTGSGITFADSTVQASAGPVTVIRSMTPVPSVTTGEIDAQTYTMAANTMSVDGQKAVFNARFLHAANTNSATYKFYANGTAIITQARTTSSETESVQITCIRQSSSVLFCTSVIINGTTVTGGGQGISTDFTGAVIFKTAVSGATANADMTAEHLRGEIWH